MFARSECDGSRTDGNEKKNQGVPDFLRPNLTGSFGRSPGKACVSGAVRKVVEGGGGDET